MYSRYIPNASGGFDRQQLPDEADLRAAQGRAPPSEEMQNPKSKMQDEGTDPAGGSVGRRQLPQPDGMQNAGTGNRERGTGDGGTGPSMPLRSGQDERLWANTARPQVPQAPGIHPPPPPPPVLGGLLGPGGLLRQLLPRGIDTEDLLILAILLLSMKQDGASPTELLIAVGLYFWL